jgi:hypothetical protein
MDCLHLCLHSWETQVLSIDNPWGALYDLRRRKYLFTDEMLSDRIAHLEFFRRLVLCYPTIPPLAIQLVRDLPHQRRWCTQCSGSWSQFGSFNI